MVKSKLVQLLKTFSVLEMKEFAKFLEGTSYRKTSGVYMLFKFLKKYHPEFSEKNIEKENILKKAFKDKPPSNQRLFDLMSMLYNTVENFLIQKKLETERVDRDFLVLKILKERKLDKLFFQKAVGVERDWEKNPIAGIEHLHDIYKLHRMCFLHPNYSIIDKPITQEILYKEIDDYYFSVKMYIMMIFMIQNKYVKISNDEVSESQFFNNILEFSKTTEYSEVASTKLLSMIIDALKNKNFETVEEIKEVYIDNIKSFNENEQLDFFGSLMTMNFIKFREGSENALTSLFELNKFAVQNDILLEDGFINTGYFRSIVQVGCAVNELDWTEEFVNKYEQFLDQELKESNVILSKSEIAFEKKQYESVLQMTVKAKFENAVYASQVKMLQLQCYFELEGYEDTFYNLVKSFTAFLQRSKVFSDQYVKPVLNFIRFTNKLFNSKNSIEKNRDSLELELNDLSNIVKKKWLIEKLNEQKKPSK